MSELLTASIHDDIDVKLQHIRGNFDTSLQEAYCFDQIIQCTTEV